MKIEEALDALGWLIREGVEFPDAITKICRKFKVGRKELMDRYDLKCLRGW